MKNSMYNYLAPVSFKAADTSGRLLIPPGGSKETMMNKAGLANALDKPSPQSSVSAPASNPPSATSQRPWYSYLINPTDNNYTNYGIAGGLGALALGGLGGLFSSRKNTLSNSLLFALLGGGLGLGAKYMADKYKWDSVPSTAPAAK